MPKFTAYVAEPKPPWYLPIAVAAYRTAMRKGEILTLAIPRVDLKEGFIRLRPEETKTSKGRSIPLHPELMEALKNALKVRHLTCELVFQRDGNLFTPHDVRVAHEAELKTLIFSIGTPVGTTAKTENKKEVSANV